MKKSLPLLLLLLSIDLFASGSASNASSGVTGSADSYTGQIETASDKTYVLDHYAAYASTVSSIRVKCTSGTITAALKIDGTNITSCSSISVTSSSATTTCTAANTLAAGSTLTLVTSSNSSCTDLVFTVKTTRS